LAVPASWPLGRTADDSRVEGDWTALTLAVRATSLPPLESPRYAGRQQIWVSASVIHTLVLYTNRQARQFDLATGSIQELDSSVLDGRTRGSSRGLFANGTMYYFATAVVDSRDAGSCI